MKPTVAIGMIGSNLDAGTGRARWEHWRPTVALCTQPDLVLHRLDLLHQRDALKTVETIIEDLKGLSPETTVVPHEVNLQNPWDFEEVYEVLFDFSQRYHFSPDEEDYLIHITTGTHVAQICMFLLVESRYLPGRLIQTSPPKAAEGGPGDYTTIDLDLSRYDKIATRFAREQREGVSFLKSGIETLNTNFNRLIEQIEKVAIASKSPILLSGPTGAGKTHLARKIFELKKSKHQVEGEFVEINCATLRGDTAMSMLFGHKRGAFTGAQNDREGLLRRAHKGLLFLDEIGELGLDEQAMLLRAIEEKRFLPVGADRESSSEFQLLAGTNRDLLLSVQQGSFREDLWARINLWPFRLPGLKERPEDIAPNFEFELQKLSQALGKQITINKEAKQRFLQFAKSSDAVWAGNFRDLNAAVTRMSTLCQAGRISLQDVEDEIVRLQRSWGSSTQESKSTKILEELLDEQKIAALDPFDIPQLISVIEVCKSSRTLSEAGRLLFASSRTQKSSSNDADRLRKYLTRFGLSWEQVK
jgi:transcriptional regulatory protein RtcR